MNNWKLIDSAPKDGRELLLYDGTRLVVGFYHQRFKCWLISYFSDDFIIPTHWMELPEEPT